MSVSRGIIVAVQVGAVKIYVAAEEALRKKERQGETQGTIKIDVFLSFNPPWMLMNFFVFNLTLCMTKLRVPVLFFPDFTDISIVLQSLLTAATPQESNTLSLEAHLSSS